MPASLPIFVTGRASSGAVARRRSLNPRVGRAGAVSWRRLVWNQIRSSSDPPALPLSVNNAVSRGTFGCDLVYRLILPKPNTTNKCRLSKCGVWSDRLASKSDLTIAVRPPKRLSSGRREQVDETHSNTSQKPPSPSILNEVAPRPKTQGCF